MESPTTPEWKVEWIDREGLGHETVFNDVYVADEYVRLIRDSDISAMCDIYKRTISAWERL